MCITATETSKTPENYRTWTARIISGSGPRDSKTPMFKEL